jgi:hypothetical protein
MVKKDSTKIGGPMARTPALKQRQAHPRLKFLDSTTQRRLSDVQRFGGAAEVTVFGQGLCLPQKP